MVQELQEVLARKVVLVQQETLDQQVRKELQVILVQQAQQVRKVVQVLQVHKVFLVY